MDTALTYERKASAGHNVFTENETFSAVTGFVKWIEKFGEASQDQYDFWAAKSGQWAKSLYYKNHKLGAFPVAPLILLDAFFPASRKYFQAPQRFPIADAHYAMGFALLYSLTDKTEYFQTAMHYIDALRKTRCPGYEAGWGYPFDWMTESGWIKRFTPLITTTPYVYEAHAALFDLTEDQNLLETMQAIARHVANDYFDVEVGPDTFACSYIPSDKLAGVQLRNVVNASAYRAFMLTDAAARFSNDHYRKIAQGNLNYVLSAQRGDGSWLYATNGPDSFIDHFHTCFVLKNLIKIEQITGNRRCREAIDSGIGFYVNHLFDENNLPRPFAKIQRFVPFRQELYDYAESINLAVLEKKNHPVLRKILESQISDLLNRWQKPDGSFRTRKLLIGWNNVPYHRWAQSQLFRSLCFYLYNENNQEEAYQGLNN